MGKKMTPKMQNEFVVAIFCSEILPMVSCLFVKNKKAAV